MIDVFINRANKVSRIIEIIKNNELPYLTAELLASDLQDSDDIELQLLERAYLELKSSISYCDDKQFYCRELKAIFIAVAKKETTSKERNTMIFIRLFQVRDELIRRHSIDVLEDLEPSFLNMLTERQNRLNEHVD